MDYMMKDFQTVNLNEISFVFGKRSYESVVYTSSVFLSLQIREQMIKLIF